MGWVIGPDLSDLLARHRNMACIKNPLEVNRSDAHHDRNRSSSNSEAGLQWIISIDWIPLILCLKFLNWWNLLLTGGYEDIVAMIVLVSR